jgi:hypothetical protein
VALGESASLAGGKKKNPECNLKLKRRKGTSFIQTIVGMELSRKIIKKIRSGFTEIKYKFNLKLIISRANRLTFHSSSKGDTLDKKKNAKVKTNSRNCLPLAWCILGLEVTSFSTNCIPNTLSCLYV